MFHNRPELKSLRRELRNNTTPAEIKLWGSLQRSNLGGYKFRRQHSVGPYILDFYCPAEKLAIELDGDSHFTDDASAHDIERTAYLHALNIKVLRFLNTDIYDNLIEVCERILVKIRDGGEVDLPPPAPPKTGGETLLKPSPVIKTGGRL